MSGERAEAEKSGGKPCQGMGNLIRLLAKRKADEEALRSANADEGVEESPSKRDIGGSAKLTFESEDERHRQHSRKPASDDPFAKPATAYDRGQPYGRIGRTRTTVQQTVLVPEPKRPNSRPCSRTTIA